MGPQDELVPEIFGVEAQIELVGSQMSRSGAFELSKAAASGQRADGDVRGSTRGPCFADERMGVAVLRSYRRGMNRGWRLRIYERRVKTEDCRYNAAEFCARFFGEANM